MSGNYALYVNLIKKANQITSTGFIKTGQVVEVYDKEIGKSVIEIKGSLAAKNNINLRSPKKPIKNYRFIIVQFKPEATKDFSFNFKFKVNKDQTFRINFSNLNRANKFTKDHTWNVKLDNSGVWIFLTIDLKAIISQAYTRFTQYEVEEICFYPHIRLKNIVFSDTEFKINGFPKDIEICANLNTLKDYKLLRLEDIDLVKEVEVEPKDMILEDKNIKKKQLKADDPEIKAPKKYNKAIKKAPKQSIKETVGEAYTPADDKQTNKNINYKQIRADIEEPKKLNVKQRNIVELSEKVDKLDNDRNAQKKNIAMIANKRPKHIENKFLIPSPIFSLEYLLSHRGDSQFTFVEQNELVFSSTKNIIALNTSSFLTRLIKIPIGDLEKFVYVKEKSLLVATNTMNPCSIFVIDYVTGTTMMSFKLTDKYETVDIDYAQDCMNDDLIIVLLTVRTTIGKINVFVLQLNVLNSDYSIQLKENLKADCLMAKFKSQDQSTEAIALQRTTIDYLTIKGSKLERTAIEDHKLEGTDIYTDFVIIEDSNTANILEKNYYLLVSSEKGVIYSFDCENKLFLRSVKAHNNRISSIAYDSYSETIISGDELGKLKYWSIDMNEEIAEYNLQSNIVATVHNPRTESTLIYLSNNCIGLVDKVLGTFNLLSKSHCDQIVDCCYNKVFGYLITVARDNRILIWETNENFGVIYEFESKDSSLTFCSSENTGTTLIAGTASSHIRLFDLKKFEFLREIKVTEEYITKGRYSTDDSYCIILDRTYNLTILDKKLRILNTIEPLYQLNNIDISNFVLDIDITNKYALYTVNSNSLGLYDLKNRKALTKIIAEQKIVSARLAFVDEIVIVLDKTNMLYMYKKSDTSISSYVITKSVRGLNSNETLSMYSSLNCNYVFTLGVNGNLRVWDFYFRGQLKPEHQEIELNDNFDTFIVTEDKNRKVFLVNRKEVKIAVVNFKGNFAIDEYLDELTKIKKGMVEEKNEIEDCKNGNDVQNNSKMALNQSLFIGDQYQPKYSIMDNKSSNINDESKKLNNDIYELPYETKILPSKLKPSTRVLTGLSYCTSYQSQLIINLSKGYFMHLVGNRLLSHRLNPEKTVEEFEVGDEISGFNLLAASPDKTKVFITNHMISAPLTKIYIYNSSFLRKYEAVIEMDDIEYLSVSRIERSNKYMLIVGKCKTTKGNKIKLFDLSKNQPQLVCETVLKESIENACWIENNSNEKEFMVISQKNIYFFKLTLHYELMFLTLDFTGFNYFEIDFSHHALAIDEMFNEYYAFVGSTNGSLIVVDIRSASVVLSIPFMFKRSILDIRILKTKEYVDDFIFDWIFEIIVVIDSENLVIFDQFKAANMEEFIAHLYKADKRLLNTDGHIISMDMDISDPKKGILLTNNASIFFFDITQLANVKVVNWHSASPVALLHDVYQQSIIVGASDNNIAYYEDTTLYNMFSFFTPGKSCTVLTLYKDNTIVIAGFNDGSIRFYNEESYVGNTLIEKEGYIIAIKTLENFHSNLILGSKTGIYLSFIDANLNMRFNKLIEIKVMSLDSQVCNSQIFLSAITEESEVISWQLVDVLSAIDLPKNNTTPFTILGLETTSLHQIDSYTYLSDKLSQRAQLKAYPYEIYCISIYSEASQSIFIRNIMDHRTIMEVAMPSYVSSVIFARLYRALLVGTTNGKLIIYDLDRKGIVYNEYVHNERIIDMIEGLRTSENGNPRSTEWFVDMHFRLVLLTKSCLLEFVC